MIQILYSSSNKIRGDNMKAGTMRPGKKVLGLGLAYIAVDMIHPIYELPMVIKVAILGISAYFLIVTGRQR